MKSLDAKLLVIACVCEEMGKLVYVGIHSKSLHFLWFFDSLVCFVFMISGVFALIIIIKLIKLTV